MKYNLTVAVIGTGFMGKQYAEIVSRSVSRMIICGNDAETVSALARKYECSFYIDYKDMFEHENIDAAAICLPTHLHAEVSLYALEKGVNVLCEKPFASSVEECERMIERAKEKGLSLMIAHCLRFTKRFEYLRRCVSEGRFGKLLYLNFYREGPKPLWSVGNWLSDIALSGGVVRDLHIHDTDMVVGLLGIPKSVYTVGDSTVCRTVYRYERDIAVSSSASWRDIENIPADNGFDAVFENGCVKTEGEKTYLFTDGGRFEPLDDEEFSEFFGDDMYENEIRYFCHCLVNKNEPLICPASHSLDTMRVSCAESRSLEKKSEELL